MFEELWKFIQAHYKAKNYHLLLGNIQLLIPLFNQSLLSDLLYVESILNVLKEIFIQLDDLAHESHFQDYLHRYYIDSLYQRIKTFNNQLAESFLQTLTECIPRSDLDRIVYKSYEHTFQKFYNLNDVDPTKQLREDRKKRITLLDAKLERNQYAVWSDMVLSYLDAQLCAGHVVDEVQLTALLHFTEGLLAKLFNTNNNERQTKELWHDVFIAQRLLSNSLAQASLGQELSYKFLSNWWQDNQSQAAGLFLLPVIAKYIKGHVEENCTDWYELVQQINVQLSTRVPISQTTLFADHSK